MKEKLRDKSLTSIERKIKNINQWKPFINILTAFFTVQRKKDKK